ncbi:MAG TPA: efflux transporter outer membrane subunit [Bryobacteraceae bacterium]|nr:efflux transporter outer membrane subunit [Bryobacteraceae bacterium]
MKRLVCAASCSLLMLLAGCTVGPRYQKPAVNVPPGYRGQTAQEAGKVNAPSLGDEKWWTVFQDEELQKLIRTALKQSFDVRIAATRVLASRAQLGITRADQFPSASGTVGYTSEKIPGFGFNVMELQGSASWNIDFWGKYRRATEAARANLLATEWGRRAVISTVVSNVATAYFQLREFDLELAIAQRTLASRQESLQLTETLANGGAAGLLDVRQAQQLVETAAESVPELEREIQQQENLISTLLGENPGGVPRGRKLTEQPLPPAIPAGLPSSLLERRPDIRQAEQQLIAANAEIGVAKAAYFPDISLTGTGGVESASLASLFSGSAAAWNLVAAATQPIFTAGRLRSDLRLSQAQEQQALLTYEQAIQQAFRQVSDSLIAYRRYREFREHQELLATAAQDAANLSEMRYKAGATSYLEVLTNETNYFAAQLNLARARLNERLSLVQIYNALGGGWEQ